MDMFRYFFFKIKYFLKVMESWFVDDYSYKARKFIQDFGRNIELSPPKTLNEKIIYRMLYDDHYMHMKLADKVFARRYVEEKLGPGYVVPLIGIYKSFAEIDFHVLPADFVLKCSHDSGSSVVVRSGDEVNLSEIRRKLNLCLYRNYYYVAREKHYKDITPVIICEKYIDVFFNKNRNVTPELLRVHCFSGKVGFIEADYTDSDGNEYVNVYDKDWVLQEVTVGYPNNKNIDLPFPDKLDELFILSSVLTQPFDYCRIDWMISGDALYFSEFTFTPCAGRMRFKPASFDYKYGELWSLRV